MQRLLMVVVMVSSFTACATDVDEASLRTSEQELESSQIIGETFDELVPGPIGGQNGWEGDCLVVGTNTNKFLRCDGSHFAAKGVGFHDAGRYTAWVDLGPNINVVNSTSSKIAIDGPQGPVFQIRVGCDNIRVAFQQSGPTLTLLQFPCGSVTGPRPAFRVVCNWMTGGTVLSCAASTLPAEPTNFVSLTLPSRLRPFDRVSINSIAGWGATFFDNIFIWQNGGPNIPAL